LGPAPSSAVVYTFLADGEARESGLTFADLDRRARAIAAILQQSLVLGDRALMLYPPGLDYIAAFVGCLCAGVVAVPAWPPHPARLELSLPRLHSIVVDVKPSVVLTDSAGLGLAEVMIRNAPELGSLQWLATDNLDLGDLWQRRPILTRRVKSRPLISHSRQVQGS
jgi:acyl-CoA synthetase (AMP-forming)/AMP-acid ligase II